MGRQNLFLYWGEAIEGWLTLIEDAQREKKRAL
jgi:hypothetical protein